VGVLALRASSSHIGGIWMPNQEARRRRPEGIDKERLTDGKLVLWFVHLIRRPPCAVQAE